MDRKIVFAFILTFIAVVNGACDRTAVTKCMGDNNQGTDMNSQCSVYLPALTACIDPHRESCKGDPVLDAILPMESGLIAQCQKMGGGPGGCTLTSCMQATPYVSNLPQGQMPDASPEFCAAVTEQKNCVEMAKATGKCEQSAIQQYDQMVNSFDMLCGGCSPQKMQLCVQHIGSLATKEFEGYPTSAQLNAECPKIEDFKTCIEPIRVKCAQMKSAQAEQINKGITAAVQLADLVCGDDLRADFVKFGKECFDKSAFRNVTRMCKKLDTPPTQQPNAEPEPESKDEMCRRIKEELNCYTEKLEPVCSEATVDFVKRVQDSFHNIIAEPLNCPISGCPQLAVQTWMLLGLLLAAFFLY